MATIKIATLPDGRKVLSGGTFPLKDQIKAASLAAGTAAAWDPAAKTWTVAAGTDLGFLKPPAPPPAPRPLPPPPLRRDRLGRCCAAAVFKLDDVCPQGPMVCVCAAHGTYKSTYAGT